MKEKYSFQEEQREEDKICNPCSYFIKNTIENRIKFNEKLDGIFLSDWSGIVRGACITPIGLTKEEREYILNKYKYTHEIVSRIYDVCTVDVNNCYCPHNMGGRLVSFYNQGICECCHSPLCFNVNEAIENGLQVIKKILLSDEIIPILEDRDKREFLKFMNFIHEFLIYCEIPQDDIIYKYRDYVVKTPNKAFNEFIKYHSMQKRRNILLFL